MKKEKYTYDINCRFCGKVIGSMEHIDRQAVLANAIADCEAQISQLETNLLTAEGDGIGKIGRIISSVKANLAYYQSELATVRPWKEIENEKTADILNADSRCTECENEHGSYKEMAQDAESLGIPHDEFKTIIKDCEFKKCHYEEKIDSIRSEKIKEMQQRAKEHLKEYQDK